MATPESLEADASDLRTYAGTADSTAQSLALLGKDTGVNGNRDDLRELKKKLDALTPEELDKVVDGLSDAELKKLGDMARNTGGCRRHSPGGPGQSGGPRGRRRRSRQRRTGRPVMARLLVAILLAMSLSACGADSTKEHDKATECPDEGVVLRQGAPTDLPGGGSAGFTDVQTSPQGSSVHFMIGGEGVAAPYRLSVGESFSVAGSNYRVTCISSSKVTLEQAQ